MPDVEKKLCPKCQKEKPVAEGFGYRTIKGKKYKQSYCRECRSGKKDTTPKLRCKDCDTEKPATTEFFPVDKKAEAGIKQPCRECKDKKVREQRKRARKIQKGLKKAKRRAS